MQPYYHIIPIPFSEARAETSDQRNRLGQLGMTPDGRLFRYCNNGGVALATARMIQSELPGVDWDELAVAAAVAANAKIVTVTLGSTGITAADFDEGYINIEDDAGEGYLYALPSVLNGGVAANATVAASGTATITLADVVEALE